MNRVAKRLLLILVLALVPIIPVVAEESDNLEHNLFSEILKEYVRDGAVNYEELCTDGRLDQYLTQLANTDPDTLSSRESRFAFWINTYNAYTLKIICDNYPVESINDISFGGLIIGTMLGKTVWDKEFVEVNHKKYTLNEVEHKIVRPVFKDPRAHFALVCASRSCPSLRPEAYEALRLNDQLDDQAVTFFSQATKNRFDINDEKAQLSPILDWFSEDFGKDDEEILLYVAHFLPTNIASLIRSDPKKWDLSYFDFNWRLNE